MHEAHEEAGGHGDDAEAADERREASEYMAKAPRASGKGFGTLGDLLKAKLNKG